MDENNINNPENQEENVPENTGEQVSLRRVARRRLLRRRMAEHRLCGLRGGMEQEVAVAAVPHGGTSRRAVRVP